MSGPGRLHVVAPHATRTGSTRVLIDLLGAAAPSLGVGIALTVLADGPLYDELAACGSPLAVGEKPSAVLYNSVVSLPDQLPTPGVPFGVYVHEPAEVLAGLGPRQLQALRSAALVMCVSERQRGDVLDAGVDPSKVAVVPPVVEVPAMPNPSAVAAARLECGAGPDDRLVVGCGEASWRKGTDLFVEVARLLAADEQVRFAWVGRRLRSVARILDHDVEALGLEGRLTWVGDVAATMPYLAGADLLLMSSRTDPQPLVPLEAAAVGTPTVAFAVGGLRDLGEAGAALVAAYPDVASLAGHARQVLDGGAGAALVVNAQRRRDETQSPEVVVPAFVAAVGRLIGQDAPMPGTDPAT